MASHWIGVSSNSLAFKSGGPWKDEGRSLLRVVHGILGIEFGLLRYETRSNRTTWWVCVCSSHQWQTRSRHTQRLELASRIVDMWIVDKFAVIPTHFGHIHLSDLDVPLLHGFEQLFVNQRNHRTYTSCSWIDFYSLNHSGNRCVVWSLSSLWCIWRA